MPGIPDNTELSPTGTPPAPVTSSPDTTPIPPPVPPTAPTPSTPTAPAHKSKTLLWLVILVVIVVAAGGGAYLYHQHQTKKKQQAAAAAAPKDIPLLTVGLIDGPDNQFYPTGQDSGGQDLVDAQSFEGLVAYNGTKIVPQLATNWTNPDNTTWIFNLRPNVQFHTGRTMTATDVKYSLENFSSTVYGQEFGSTIQSVTVVSPSQVKITTSAPDPLLLNRLARLYILDSNSKVNNSPINGTGPYTLKPGTTASTTTVDLVAFNNYHGGHVYTRELDIKYESSPQLAATDLKNHSINIFGDTDTLTYFKSIPGLITTAVNPIGVSFMGINTNQASSPLANVLFRRALDVGIDRTKIISASGVSGEPIGQFVTSAIPGYDPSLTPAAQNITEAKQLISQAGLTNPTFTLSVGSSSNLLAATEIQKEYAAIGVTVNIKQYGSINDLLNDVLGGKTQAYVLGYTSDLFDASDTFSTVFQNKNYDNPTVDKDISEANQTLNQSQRVSLLQKAADQLHSDVAAVPLYQQQEYMFQTSAAYSLHPEIDNVDVGVYFWQVHE